MCGAARILRCGHLLSQCLIVKTHAGLLLSMLLCAALSPAAVHVAPSYSHIRLHKLERIKASQSPVTVSSAKTFGCNGVHLCVLIFMYAHMYVGDTHVIYRFACTFVCACLDKKSLFRSLSPCFLIVSIIVTLGLPVRLEWPASNL